jgi:hypothetical protein
MFFICTLWVKNLPPALCGNGMLELTPNCQLGKALCGQHRVFQVAELLFKHAFPNEFY